MTHCRESRHAGTDRRFTVGTLVGRGAAAAPQARLCGAACGRVPRSELDLASTTIWSVPTSRRMRGQALRIWAPAYQVAPGYQRHKLHQQFEVTPRDSSALPRDCCSPRLHGQPGRRGRPVRRVPCWCPTPVRMRRWWMPVGGCRGAGCVGAHRESNRHRLLRSRDGSAPSSSPAFGVPAPAARWRRFGVAEVCQRHGALLPGGRGARPGCAWRRTQAALRVGMPANVSMTTAVKR